MLAVAVDVARREGLDLPIPVTLRFPNAPRAEESAWQETAVRHLRVGDWHQLTFDEELDFVGPVAQRVLLRHGLLWPPNAHFHLPILEDARGGSLTTGIEGDGLFGWRWARVAGLLARRTHPVPRDVLRVGLALAPEPVRVRKERTREPHGIGWLLPPARRVIDAAVYHERATEPRRWDKQVSLWARSRYLSFLRESLGTLADDEDVLLIHPLLDGRFLASLAAAGGRFGFGERTSAFRELFGTVLPGDLVARTSKAFFIEPFWGRHSRRFVQEWRGGDLPGGLINEEALREEWLSAIPHFASSVPLQQAWLASSTVDRAPGPFQGV